MQPIRGNKYHSALEPKLVPLGTTFDVNDVFLYKTVEPISKWRHSSKNWDPVVNKMTGIMLYDGERETAREVMRRTFAEIKLIQMNKRKKLAGADANSVEVSPIKIINQAVANCTPLLVLHKVRRGGFIYKVVPAPARDVDTMHIAIKWIVESARNKDKNQRIWVSLAHELINAANNEGTAIGKKKELSKQFRKYNLELMISCLLYLGRCNNFGRPVLNSNPFQTLLSRITSYSGYARLSKWVQFRRFNHQPSKCPGSIQNIRNVGLIAHIDAGKTTTTERMLYFAGRTRAVGEVDRGDTVTDYLVEERERGISIVSAAACLSWRQHDVHLIDTPGHVDFTFEVERGLAAVDSALIIIDACKGVETQTRTVWSQADRYQLPRMIFVNKMDRPTANFINSMRSLRERFGGTFLPLQMPVFNTTKEKFVGIVDLPSLMLKVVPHLINAISLVNYTHTHGVVVN
ncbi:unnamed protein product [Rodentolepis nana]|uniref:Tr-type G domain-containing protein n=1 Tax=Rodentolepis nana TaxID=102285 RepID=A0A0R3TCZ8_RODNA|nr:unnamed protein product [Rodentolepis nana]